MNVFLGGKKSMIHNIKKHKHLGETFPLMILEIQENERKNE